MCPSNTETTAVKNLRVRELELVTVFVLYWSCGRQLFSRTVEARGFLLLPPQDVTFKRPWSNSQDTAWPMPKRQSVTGWPHFFPIRADVSRASSRREVSKTTQVRGSTGAARAAFAQTGDVARQGRHLPCKQSYAGALPAISSIFINYSPFDNAPSALSLRAYASAAARKPPFSDFMSR